MVESSPSAAALGASTDVQRILDCFKAFDDNGDGSIDAREFGRVLKAANSEFFTEDVINCLFDAADDNKDGTICYAEFVSFLFCEDWASELVGRVREELGVREVLPVMDGLQMWLDATMAGSIDTTDDGRVKRWRDLSGQDNDAVGVSDDSDSLPLDDKALGIPGINDIPAVHFAEGSTMKSSSEMTCKTVALVAQHMSVKGCMMLFGQYPDQDFSIRVGNGDNGYRKDDADKNDFCYGDTKGRLRLNGVEGARKWEGFPHAPVVIVAVKYTGRADGADFICSLSSGFDRGRRGFDGALGEVVVYDRELSRDETEKLEQYLMSKWITKSLLKPAKQAALGAKQEAGDDIPSRGKSTGSVKADEPNRRKSGTALPDGKTRSACKYRGDCHNKDAKHVSRFCHPGDDDYQKPVCKHGSTCYRSDEKHLQAFSHPDDGDRRPCPYALGCFRRQPHHLSKFAHPGDADYFDKVRSFGGKACFLTMMQCFKFCDPDNKALINDKGKVGEMLGHLDMNLSDGELQTAWEKLEDGKGLCYFPEFVEWANAQGINLPLGLEDSESTTDDLECGFMGCPCKMFKASKGSDKFCTCKHKKGLHVPSTSVEDVPNPLYWTATDLEEMGSSWVNCGHQVSHMQKLVDNSIKRTWTRDRGAGNKVPESYKVTNVFRNENPRLWRKYAMKKSMLKKSIEESELTIEPFTTKTSIDWSTTDDSDPVDADINEWYLWHGTSQEGAEAICKIDFKVRLAGTATGTLYGRGTYFAESITKADEYAKEGDANPELGLGPGLHCVLLCRIIGGNVLYTDENTPDAEELQNSCLFGNHDSVVGDREKCRGTFKEFVIFSADQAYPEYVVYFNRVYS